MTIDETEENFSKNLRALRQRFGMSQGDLARKAGIRQNVLSRMELSKANPTLRTIATIAAALGVSVGALLESEVAEQEFSTTAS